MPAPICTAALIVAIMAAAMYAARSLPSRPARASAAIMAMTGLVVAAPLEFCAPPASPSARPLARVAGQVREGLAALR